MRSRRSPLRQSTASGWRSLSFDDRAAIFLKAADLLAGPWRDTLNAATMLGQSKTAVQAEIDSACELIDFWRFNVAFAREILAEQPVANSPGSWNRLDHRPLEGFVYAITPFNFTAIGGNLPTAPALMGNVVLWKPSPTQQLAAHYTMRLLEEAGLPPGVINCFRATASPCPRSRLSTPRSPASTSPARRRRFSDSGTRSDRTSRPTARTRGSSARPVARTSCLPTRPLMPAALRTALIRGAFEYQGQKCSAASRAYVARSVWDRMSDDFLAETDALDDGRRQRLLELHGCGHRPAGVRQARGRARARPRRRDRSPSQPAGRATTARATSSVPLSWSVRIPRTRSSRPSTSGRSSASTCSTTATTTRSCASWRVSPPTR